MADVLWCYIRWIVSIVTGKQRQFIETQNEWKSFETSSQKKIKYPWVVNVKRTCSPKIKHVLSFTASAIFALNFVEIPANQNVVNLEQQAQCKGP